MEEINKNFQNTETNSLKDYLNLIRNNLLPVILITITSLTVAIIYAVNAQDIYSSVTSLKISKPSGNILESPLMPEFQDFGSDRFIANELEILKSYSIRSRVAESIIQTFHETNKPDSFYLVLDKEFNFEEQPKKILPQESIAKLFADRVTIDQKRGLDIVEITVESPSPYEAALIANTYAQEYKELNLDVSRNQLTNVKEFLSLQRKEKMEQLNEAEDILKNYQQKGGIIALDAQATNLIQQLSQFEAKKNAADIELSVSNRVLSEYKNELEKQSPRMAEYLESMSNEAYFTALQEQIARLQVNKDLALAEKKSKIDTKTLIKEYDQKITDLKQKLDEKISVIKKGIFASSPEEVKKLSQNIIEEEVKNQSLKITSTELAAVVRTYDAKFNQLPTTAIELARFQRQRESLEKLYILVEEKYQEALINEQSQPGNVLIIDAARKANQPSKPNRLLIVLIGLVLGGGMAFGYVFIRNYFDNTVKTPEDIQNRNISVLAWIPQIEGSPIDGQKDYEFVVAKRPDSIPSEAFRALRTRVQFSKIDRDALKVILVTSSAPQEGKTTVSINLAGSFAQTNKRTLIVDCDLRKPRMHNVFKQARFPGVIDYLFGQATLNEIIRKSELNNLDFITAGTIPPNPAEMLESDQMGQFINDMRERYDIVILDSPPIIAVTDSEILARKVDGTILVVSAEVTEIEMMEKSIDLLKNAHAPFIGTVLNNFSYKSGYGSYYKYYYYYSRPTNGAKSKSKSGSVEKKS
ncbi:MAG: polysaccharide biosynthesis tyrosine autokinase [Ignavibacteria bacterium]|nr:polysaccharide biosynthesis tyrosine autokinase [Ignavibacteria bacterium]